MHYRRLESVVQRRLDRVQKLGIVAAIGRRDMLASSTGASNRSSSNAGGPGTDTTPEVRGALLRIGRDGSSSFPRLIPARPHRHTHTQKETARMHAALDTPEGQRLLQEFLTTHAQLNPEVRAEQDAYLQQLEREDGGKRVPDGKVLVWPEPKGFVVKARRRRRPQSLGGGEEEEEEKLFVNVVVSERLRPPWVEVEGRVWRVPNALGPPRVEKDHGACVSNESAVGVHVVIQCPSIVPVASPYKHAI